MAQAPENLPLAPIDELLHEFAQAKSSAKSIAGRMKDAARLKFARCFCATVLETYWNAVCRERSCRWRLNAAFIEYSGLKRSEELLAAQLGTMLPRSPVLEAGYLIGTVYTALLPEVTRSELGAYYTPPALVKQLVSSVSDSGFNWARGRVLDPACGGAAFMTPVAANMVRELQAAGVSEAAIVKHIGRHLHGFEIDAFAGWMAQVLLEVSLLDICLAARARLPIVVSVEDALLAPVREGALFDLVIGNPPYGRVTLPNQLRERYARSLFGHANLYGLFTDLAVRWARDGGLIAYVTPTSFLGGQYFKSLRLLLSQEAPPTVIDFISERTGVFEDVLQETLLAVYRRSGPANERTLVRSLTANGTDATVFAKTLGAYETPADHGDPWLFPRTEAQRTLLQQAMSMTCRLPDYGLAVTTGQLVWNRHKDQLRSTAGKRRLPLIWAEAVGSDGRFRFSATKRNHQGYLEIKDSQEHLVTNEPCVLVQRTTAKEQDRRLIAAVLPQDFLDAHIQGVVVENHLNMVRPATGSTAVNLDTLARLLNSPTVDYIFRCISGSVAVSAYELNALPMPKANDMKKLERLIRSNASNRKIEGFIAEIYGLPG